MKSSLENYLKQLQRKESMFPMDSIHTGKKPLDVKKPRHDWEDETKIEDEEKVT